MIIILNKEDSYYFMVEDDQSPDARTTRERSPGMPRCEPESLVGAVARRHAVQRVSSSDLLKGACQMVIEHDGEEYHLRLTSKGKLILTK